MQMESMIAPCGMDCAQCPIFIAARDPVAAERLAQAWHSSGHPDAKPSWFRCQGCRGDRSVRWSEPCGISQCCVDDKDLDFCYECNEFPCERLEEWAAAHEHHRPALDRLKEMKELSALENLG